MKVSLLLLLTAAATPLSQATRGATVTIGGQTVTVTQAAGTNTFTLSTSTWNVGAPGGTRTVAITASYSDAPWTATSNQAWLSVSAGTGAGSGTIVLTAQATELGASPRVATVTFGGGGAT